VSKYKNQPITIDNIKFMSKREGYRYLELSLLQRHGRISDLKLQVKFILHAGIKYIADFVYMENGQLVVEDCKGVRTAVYRLKKKLMKAEGYDIRET
jgi:hypothetical protein